MNLDAKKAILVSFFCLSGAIGLHPEHLQAEQADLTPHGHASSVLRVKTVVEVTGSLQDDSPNGTSAPIPLKVDAELFFDERGLEGNGFPAVRHYWEAKADIVVNENEQHRELRESRRVILLSETSTIDRYTSPRGALTRDELDLIDIQGSGFPLERLLPSSPVAIGDEWTHAPEVITELLRIDRSNDGALTSELTELTDEVAKIDLRGRITGKVNGTQTEIEVMGNYHFDRQTKTVNWLALSLKEQRGVGFATPGFDVVARMRVARKRIDTSEALTDNLVRRIRLRPTDGDKLIELGSENGLYRISMDRRWYLLSQRDSSAMLRMVDDGDLIATCKVDRLNRMVPGKQITLDGFQADVRRALDRNCEEIVAASETVNPQGVRMLRVEAAGKAAKTPIRWVYFHLSNDRGQRLSFIFTHEASLATRFAGSDESLTSSVEFLSEPERQAGKATAFHR